MEKGSDAVGSGICKGEIKKTGSGRHPELPVLLMCIPPGWLPYGFEKFPCRFHGHRACSLDLGLGSHG